MAQSPARVFADLRGRLPGLGIVLGGALAAAIVAGSGQTARACSLSTGETAVLVRALQSHLMVAGLSCGQSAQYNQFVKGYQAELIRHGQNLKSHYSRQYGGSAKRQLNAGVTRMANEASQRSMANRAAFCAEGAAVFQALAADPGHNLATFVTTQAPFSLSTPACETRTAQK